MALEAPAQCRREDPAGLRNGGGRGRFGAATLPRDGRRDRVGVATCVDQGEVVEIRRDVQRDAMVRDPTFDAQPDGADLARPSAVRIAPAPGLPVTPTGVDAQLATR